MKKIIITGYGRSGTSMLMILLTRLGFDTGMKPHEEHLVEKIRAGCELQFDIHSTKTILHKQFKKAPRILKAPTLSFLLRNLVKDKVLDVEHVIIPIRDIVDSANSRIKVGLGWETNIDENYFRYSGDRVNDTIKINAMALGYIIEACMYHRIPFTLMRFPDFVQNEKTCYDILVSIFGKINRKKFNKIFKEVMIDKKV